jgi:hypothetical protein
MYDPVVDTLLSIPEQLPEYPVEVYWTDPQIYKDNPDLNEDSYVDIRLVNPNYIEPPVGTKAWGGKGDNQHDAPEGYYNVNWDNYNKYFGMGLIEWSKLIDSSITKPDNISWEKAIATFLFELTFYGWSWEEQKILIDELNETRRKYEEAEKDGRLEIKEKACFGKFDVISIIPRDEEITGSD